MELWDARSAGEKPGANHPSYTFPLASSVGWLLSSVAVGRCKPVHLLARPTDRRTDGQTDRQLETIDLRRYSCRPNECRRSSAAVALADCHERNGRGRTAPPRADQSCQ